MRRSYVGFAACALALLVLFQQRQQLSSSSWYVFRWTQKPIRVALVDDGIRRHDGE